MKFIVVLFTVFLGSSLTLAQSGKAGSGGGTPIEASFVELGRQSLSLLKMTKTDDQTLKDLKVLDLEEAINSTEILCATGNTLKTIKDLKKYAIVWNQRPPVFLDCDSWKKADKTDSGVQTFVLHEYYRIATGRSGGLTEQSSYNFSSKVSQILNTEKSLKVTLDSFKITNFLLYMQGASSTIHLEIDPDSKTGIVVSNLRDGVGGYSNQRNIEHHSDSGYIRQGYGFVPTVSHGQYPINCEMKSGSNSQVVCVGQSIRKDSVCLKETGFLTVKCVDRQTLYFRDSLVLLPDGNIFVGLIPTDSAGVPTGEMTPAHGKKYIRWNANLPLPGS